MNVIQGHARARFNIRYNDLHTNASLQALVEQRAAKAAQQRTGRPPLNWRIEWRLPSNVEAFRTAPGKFTDMVVASIRDVTGRTPDLNTLGGTSDARFITNYCRGSGASALSARPCTASTNARRCPTSNNSRVSIATCWIDILHEHAHSHGVAG